MSRSQIGAAARASASAWHSTKTSERERERERDRDRGREAERQRGRERQRERERQRGREAERERGKRDLVRERHAGLGKLCDFVADVSAALNALGGLRVVVHALGQAAAAREEVVHGLVPLAQLVQAQRQSDGDIACRGCRHLRGVLGGGARRP
eukprot:COSAG03_NODE_2950_length_2334_cov_34.359284_2_plen_154_part_00